MRIPRSIFADISAPFKLRVLHNFLVSGATRTVTWPPGSTDANPSTWQEAIIDFSSPPRPDSENPTVTAQIENDRPGPSEDVRIDVNGHDDVDIELLELWVDGVLAQSFATPGTTDRYAHLWHLARYPVGSHTYQAKVFDHAGRVDYSDFKTFRVVVDGRPPRITLRVNPAAPTAGHPLTVTASASDDAGVRLIQISEVMGAVSPSRQRCDFPSGRANEVCTWTFTPDPRLMQLHLNAFAEDAEGFHDSVDRVIPLGNSGPDRDQDRLSDRMESRLCTDPDKPDTDGDGLSDGWEVAGIAFADGSVEPLPDYGVNPCYRDVLVQLDHEAGARPPATAVLNLRNRYREHGIRMYLEEHERPRPTAYNQSHIGSVQAVYQTTDLGKFYLEPQRNWAFYYVYESNSIGVSGTWPRFVTLNHYTGARGVCSGGSNAGKDCSTDADCPDGGTFATCSAPCTIPVDPASGAPLGRVCWTRSDDDLAYRLIHELGHVVGLGHGGRTVVGAARLNSAHSNRGFVTLGGDWDDTNYKPNQLSVMNYRYSFKSDPGCMKPLTAGSSPPFIIRQLTYLDRDMGDLDENALSEAPNSTFATRLRALNCHFADPDAFPVFKYHCSTGGTQYQVISDGRATLARRPTGGAWDLSPPRHAPGIDWNCNGRIDAGTVSQDINGDGDGEGDYGDGTKTLLHARDEWSNIPNPVNCQLQ